MGNLAEYQYAGFWLRFVASVIDSICILAVTMPLLYLIYGNLNFVSPNSGSMGVWEVLLSYVFPAIVIVLFWLYRSATPGKIMLGLKIIRIDGAEKLTPQQSVVRYLGYYVSMLPLFLGFLWVAFDEKKQGWHDKLAGTLVIKNSY